jgi:hypothetical protein
MMIYVISLPVKDQLLLSDLIKVEFSGHIFKKFCNIKFNETPLSRSGVVSSERKGRQAGRRTDGQTDITKLIVAFLNCAKAPKREKNKSYIITSVSIYD